MENATKDSGNDEREEARRLEDQRVRAPPHSNNVVGESPLTDQGSSEMCGQGDGGGRCRDPAACSTALPKGQRQRLWRSDSDRAILGRVDYKAVKRDLR